MKNLKAIPTTYNGTEYRSRLEARWAIFFDSLEIKFEYELEGYQITEKIKYLPDFYLPELKCFVEVKPSLETITMKDIEKLNRFSTHEDEINLLLIIGSPGKQKMYLLNRSSGIPIDEFEADDLTEAEQVEEYLVYCESVKFEPLPFYSNPRFQIVYETVNDYISFLLIDAIKESQFQFKEFKGGKK